MATHTNDAIRDAWFEIEHVSGLFETMQRTRDRFREVNKREPIDRLEGLRHAVEETRDDFEKMTLRIDRWWRPFDHAFDKLISARVVPSRMRSDPDSGV